MGEEWFGDDDNKGLVASDWSSDGICSSSHVHVASSIVSESCTPPLCHLRESRVAATEWVTPGWDPAEFMTEEQLECVHHIAVAPCEVYWKVLRTLRKWREIKVANAHALQSWHDGLPASKKNVLGCLDRSC